MEPAVPNGAAAAAEPPPPAVREQDRLMPIANVIRIMRRVLPPHAKISDDAKELIQECVSEFISFVTGEANERCHGEHRKTVTAEDVVWAMDRLGFDDYVLPLSVYLQRMRECEGGGGGGDRAVPRAAPRAAPRPVCAPCVPGHGVQVQVQQAVYAPPAPAQAYAAVAMPPVPANAPPHVIGQYGVFGCQLPVDAPYYGENGAYGAGGGRGGCADESSSSSTRAPAPAVGTGSQ